MIESLHAHQIEKVLELGAWRDEGRRFAVGLHGEVFKNDDDKECQDERRQRQAAAPTPPSSSAPSTASNSEPSGKNRSQALRAKYAKHLDEVSTYYPSLISCGMDDGIWAIVQSYPLGRDGPRFWICAFLSYSDIFDPKAFAFSKITPIVRPVGFRHTNYPDASVCGYTAEDDAWRPGDSPLTLLNLYAEWIICQLYLALEGKWPGPQFGMDAIYRNLEFGPKDWCTCDTRRRYRDCHMAADRVEVELLKAAGRYKDHGSRKIPIAIQRFARSRWKRVPTSSELHLHPYEGLPPRDFA